MKKSGDTHLDTVACNVTTRTFINALHKSWQGGIIELICYNSGAGYVDSLYG